MKAKSIFFYCFCILIILYHSNLSAQFYSVNMEGGGAVTEIIQSKDADGTYIYARCDNGGVYRRPSSGFYSWSFMARNFFINGTRVSDISSFMVQGLAVHPTNPNTLIICCGADYIANDYYDQTKGIWKSTDAGETWHKKFDFNFEGVRSEEKNGGECIVYDETNPNIIYAGGRYPGGFPNISTQINKLLKSTNGGETWAECVSLTSPIRGNITSIVINPIDHNIVWVGTRVEHSGNENGWMYCFNKCVISTGNAFQMYKTDVPGCSADDLEYVVFRTVIDKYSNRLFIAFGEKCNNGFVYGLRELNPTSGLVIEDLTDKVDHAGLYGGYNSGYALPVSGEFMHVGINYQGSSSYLTASRMSSPTCQSSSLTSGSPLLFYATGMRYGIDAYPKHIYASFYNTYQDYSRINWGRNNLTGISSHYDANGIPTQSFERYFMSGGGGPTWTDISFLNHHYMTSGINQTVVYNTTFEKRSGHTNVIYLPISDWTMARITDGGASRETYDYARQKCNPNVNEADKDISNVTRVLIPDNTSGSSIAYVIGANIYSRYGPANRGVIFTTSDYGNTYQKILNTANLGIGTGNFPLIDGLVDDENPNNLVVLVGGGQEVGVPELSRDKDAGIERNSTSGIEIGPIGSEVPGGKKSIAPNYRGLFFSQDGGNSWSRGLGNPSNLFEHAVVNDVFNYYKCLAKDKVNKNNYYMYLKEGYSTTNGGVYKSTDKGHNWVQLPATAFLRNETQYLDNGSIVTHNLYEGRIYVGIKRSHPTKRGGLFVSWNSGNSFERVDEGIQADKWVSVQTLDVFNNKIAVFGKKWNDALNKIYLSNDYGATFSEITNDNFRLPTTSSLEFNPNANELWISTAGQGVLVYPLGSEEEEATLNRTPSNGWPKEYKLYQNYPNPFNPTTNIFYDLKEDTRVKIEVMDITGRVIEQLVDEYKSGGAYQVKFNAKNVSSGIYFYKITTPSFMAVKKMVLIK